MPRLEAEIDELVFDLYGLTQTERQLVLAAHATAQKQGVEDEGEEGGG